MRLLSRKSARRAYTAKNSIKRYEHPRLKQSSRRRNYSLSLVRVDTLHSTPIHRGGDVVIGLPGLDRTVCVRCARIQSRVDFRVWAARSVASINVVAHYGGSARIPQKTHAALRRWSAATSQRLDHRAVGRVS